MAHDKEPFSRWLVGSVVIPLAAALIGTGIWITNRGGNDKADTAGTATTAPITTSGPPIAVPPARGGAEVRACMAQHQMSRAVTTNTTLVEARGTLPGEMPETVQPDHVIVLQRCDWPPKTWSEGDGYSKISVQSTRGPGKAEASGATVADIIKSSCSLLELRYSIRAQGYQESLPAFTAKPDRAVNLGGKDYRAPPEEPLNFYYERDELVVLRNGKIRLDGVRCMR